MTTTNNNTSTTPLITGPVKETSARIMSEVQTQTASIIAQASELDEVGTGDLLTALARQEDAMRELGSSAHNAMSRLSEAKDAILDARRQLVLAAQELTRIGEGILAELGQESTGEKVDLGESSIPSSSEEEPAATGEMMVDLGPIPAFETTVAAPVDAQQERSIFDDEPTRHEEVVPMIAANSPVVVEGEEEQEEPGATVETPEPSATPEPKKKPGRGRGKKGQKSGD